MVMLGGGSLDCCFHKYVGRAGECCSQSMSVQHA